MQFKYIISMRQQFEASRLQHSRIGFIKVIGSPIGNSTYAIAFFLLGESQLRLRSQQVNADKLRFTCKTSLHDKVQFLALVGDSHHMHFLHMLQLRQSLADVKHGRQLYHHYFSLFKQQILQGSHIGCAVADRNGLASIGIATSGVNKNTTLW